MSDCSSDADVDLTESAPITDSDIKEPVIPAIQGEGVLPALDEMVEPLNDNSGLMILSSGLLVDSQQGISYSIGSLLSSSDINLYEASVQLEGDIETVWLRQAVTDDAKSRLLKEAEILSTVDCPSFLKMKECFDVDSCKYLVTSPGIGLTLAEVFEKKELTFRQSVSILAQIAFALVRLHEKGWVHLGIRPKALLLHKPVQIVDLSYATRIGEKIPTPFYHAGYSAPELLIESPADIRSDIYSIGALLFHIANKVPVPESGAELTTFNPPQPIAGVPQILSRCLGNIETRYSSMNELHSDLLRLVARNSPTIIHSTNSTTSIGLEPSRTTNQDSFGVLSGSIGNDEGIHAWTLACVADGMGGMAAGEVASDAAVKTVILRVIELGTAIVTSAEKQAAGLKSWTQYANDRVCSALETRNARGGCTMVSALLIDHTLAIAHVGDCRAYLIHEDQITSLTRDHSLVMALVAQGELRLEDIRTHPDRSKVTRSLGDRQPMPDYYVDTLEQIIDGETMQLVHDDVVLLCSDGLWEPVLEEEMLEALHKYSPNLSAAADAIIDLALQRGAPDNATLVLIRVDENDSLREEQTDA